MRLLDHAGLCAGVCTPAPFLWAVAPCSSWIQWGLSLFTRAKKPALRIGLMLMNIAVFAAFISIQKDLFTIGLTALGLILETGLILSLEEVRDCSWIRLGLGGLILIVVNTVSPHPRRTARLGAVGISGVMPARSVAVCFFFRSCRFDQAGSRSKEAAPLSWRDSSCWQRWRSVR